MTALLSVVTGVDLSFRKEAKHPYRTLEKCIMRNFGTPTLDCSEVRGFVACPVSPAPYDLSIDVTCATVRENPLAK